MLGDIGDGAAILAAQAQALDHPQAEQDERGGQTDILEGRDQPDTPSAEPHAGERNQERVFAAHRSPIHPNRNAPSGRIRNPAVNSAMVLKQRRNRAGLVEELDRQDRGQAPEYVEVVPFDDVSHRGRDDHGPEVLGDLLGQPLLFLPILQLPEYRLADVLSYGWEG